MEIKLPIVSLTNSTSDNRKAYLYYLFIKALVKDRFAISTSDLLNLTQSAGISKFKTRSILKSIVKAGFATYNQTKDKYVLLGWSRVNNILFNNADFKRTKNKTTGTELYTYTRVAIPSIKHIESVRFAQLLIQLNNRFQYNLESLRNNQESNTTPDTHSYMLCHNDHLENEFEASVEYIRLKGGYADKTVVHRLKQELIDIGWISVTHSSEITMISPEQRHTVEFLKYNEESLKYRVRNGNVYKIGTDKIALNLDRINQSIFTSRFQTIGNDTVDTETGKIVTLIPVARPKKEKKPLSERQQRFLDFINDPVQKFQMIYHRVLPSSYEKKKVGANMLNSILNKCFERNYRAICSVLTLEDVVKVTKTKTIMRTEVDYNYKGSNKRKRFERIEVMRFELKN